MFKKLAVTIGDPAGVGPDVIKKWAETAPASLLKKVEVLGNKKFLDTLPAELGKRPVGDFPLRRGQASRLRRGAR